jgi:hypothetical protein
MSGLEKHIQKELTYLDHDLILDKAWSPFGYLYWRVLKLVKDVEPLTVVDWREGNTPLPLSVEIVNKVRSQEGDISEKVREAIVHNAARKELLRQERLAAQQEITEEWQARAKGLAKHRSGF